tara:strand:- start:418 stop:585 length:168 start_codon:yes stop_codon:yes gene_type:complete
MRVECPVCRGKGDLVVADPDIESKYLQVSLDTCHHCGGDGKVPPEMATYEAVRMK